MLKYISLSKAICVNCSRSYHFSEPLQFTLVTERDNYLGIVDRLIARFQRLFRKFKSGVAEWVDYSDEPMYFYTLDNYPDIFKACYSPGFEDAEQAVGGEMCGFILLQDEQYPDVVKFLKSKISHVYYELGEDFEVVQVNPTNIELRFKNVE